MVTWVSTGMRAESGKIWKENWVFPCHSSCNARKQQGKLCRVWPPVTSEAHWCLGTAAVGTCDKGQETSASAVFPCGILSTSVYNFTWRRIQLTLKYRLKNTVEGRAGPAVRKSCSRAASWLCSLVQCHLPPSLHKLSKEPSLPLRLLLLYTQSSPSLPNSWVTKNLWISKPNFCFHFVFYFWYWRSFKKYSLLMAATLFVTSFCPVFSLDCFLISYFLISYIPSPLLL